MTSWGKDTIARAVVGAFAAVLLSVSFAAYRHAVCTGVPKYLTLDHELRRVFNRAERESFRSALNRVCGIAADSRPQDAGVPIPPVQSTGAKHRVISLDRSIEPRNHFIFDLSPVLNL